MENRLGEVAIRSPGTARLRDLKYQQTVSYCLAISIKPVLGSQLSGG